MSVCGWEISDPGMPITLSAMITPTSTDTRTMWVLLSASQKPTWSYWLLQRRLDSYRLLVRRLTPQSAIFLLQLIDLQLIIKIILFQTKSAAHRPGIEGRAATRVFSGIASAWTSGRTFGAASRTYTWYAHTGTHTTRNASVARPIDST